MCCVTTHPEVEDATRYVEIDPVCAVQLHEKEKVDVLIQGISPATLRVVYKGERNDTSRFV